MNVTLYLNFMLSPILCFYFFFFFNDTATTEIYTLSLHDALPISALQAAPDRAAPAGGRGRARGPRESRRGRSEEHTSELQSPCNLVCRLLLEKKKKYQPYISSSKTKLPHKLREITCDYESEESTI